MPWGSVSPRINFLGQLLKRLIWIHLSNSLHFEEENHENKPRKGKYL